MATSIEPVPPAVDYTNKDYASLRRAMLDLARLRLPEWTDHTPSDLGVVLTDMVAYAADVILYYQDRIASELHGVGSAASVASGQVQGSEIAHAAFISGLNEILLVGAIVAFAGGALGFLLVRGRDFVASGPTAAGH